LITGILFGSFIILFLLHVPIGICLAVSSIFALYLIGDFNMFMIAQKMFTGMNSMPLMAIPGFVFAGNLMGKGGISNYLIKFLQSWIGHVKGGMSVVVMLCCMIFAAISGSAPATAAAVGSIMIPAMLESGYDKAYAMGSVAAGGTVGILIPPSITFVLLAVATEQSIAQMFTAGILPGILLTAAFILTSLVYAHKRGYKGTPKATWGERGKATLQAIPAMLMPLGILGSIYAGIATPTEVSFLSIVYAFIVGLFIYREINIKTFIDVLRDSITTTSMIFLIIAAAMTISIYLAAEQIPTQVVTWATENGITPFAFWVFCFLLFLVLGTFLEAVSIVLITMPVLLPVIVALDINIIHFAVFMVLMMQMAMITPPVGLNLFVLSGIGHAPLEEVVRGVLPFMLTMIVVIFIIILFPQISLWMVSLMS